MAIHGPCGVEIELDPTDIRVTVPTSDPITGEETVASSVPLNRHEFEQLEEALAEARERMGWRS